MKRITKITLSLLFAFSIMPMSALLANNENEITQNKEEVIKIDEEINEVFEDFDSSMKILVLPDGGFLQGKATVYNANDTNCKKSIAVYDSETDKNAISVAQAKIIEKENKLSKNVNNPQIVPYGTTIPTKIMVLADKSAYTSSTFSGSGWRIGGYKFKPAANTGDYLLWTSFVDSANAGTAGHVSSTINGGPNYGTALPTGVKTYVYSADWTMYYTFNPIAGSYYIVANKEINDDK